MRLDLPGILADVAEIAGEMAAYKLAEARGGTVVFIPRPEYLAEGHWLVAMLGIEKARKVAKIYTSENVEIPLGPLAGCRNKVKAAIRASLAEGKPLAEAARLAGVHMRTVRRHKNRREKPNDQHRLF